jgi:hypothetical protein
MISSVQGAPCVTPPAEDAICGVSRSRFARVHADRPANDDTTNNPVRDNDVIVNDDDEVRNDEGRDDNNGDVAASGRSRNLWARRPRICGPNNSLVMVRDGTRYEFEPVATASDGAIPVLGREHDAAEPVPEVRRR